MTNMILILIVVLSSNLLSMYSGYRLGTSSAKRQTEELFLKNSTLSLGEVAMCLDIIYRSEK